MQAAVKKLKGFQWYNQVTEPEILAIEPEKSLFWVLVSLPKKQNPDTSGI